MRALRAARFAVQLLAPRGVSPAEIVWRLVAVQAQDLRGARLALRARGQGFSAAGVAGLTVGTWSARRRGGRLRVELRPFAPIDPEAAAALAREAEDVERFEAAARRRSGAATA